MSREGPVEDGVGGEAVPPVSGALAAGEGGGGVGDGGGGAAVCGGCEELRGAAVEVHAWAGLVADLGGECGEAADDAVVAGGGFGFPFGAEGGGTNGGVVDLVVGCWWALFGLHPERCEESVAAAAATHEVEPEAADESDEREASDDAAD